jgi:hypothetical protein
LAATVFVPAPDVAAVVSLVNSSPGVVQVTWELSGVSARGIWIYTNLDVDGSFLDRIDELSPTLRSEDNNGTQPLPWDGTTEGTLRVMVGIKTHWGWVVRDANLYTIELPEPAAVLAVPVLLSAEQSGNDIVARFAYTFREGDQATIVRVTCEGSLTVSEDYALETLPAGQSVSGEVIIPTTESHGTVVTVSAISTDGTNNSAVSNTINVTMELTAPAAPGLAWGSPA